MFESQWFGLPPRKKWKFHPHSPIWRRLGRFRNAGLFVFVFLWCWRVLYPHIQHVKLQIIQYWNWKNVFILKKSRFFLKFNVFWSKLKATLISRNKIIWNVMFYCKVHWARIILTCIKPPCSFYFNRNFVSIIFSLSVII